MIARMWRRRTQPSGPAASPGSWWTTDTGSDTENVFAGDGIVVVVGSEEGIAFDGHSGERLWTLPGVRDDGRGAAQVGENVVLYWAQATGPGGLVLDRRTGRVVGPGSEPPPPGSWIAGPDTLSVDGWTVHNTHDLVTIGSPDGRHWRQRLHASYDASAPVRDGTWVYWGTADGRLNALDTAVANEATVLGLGFTASRAPREPGRDRALESLCAIRGHHPQKVVGRYAPEDPRANSAGVVWELRCRCGHRVVDPGDERG
jgi:hypothetical protein